MQTYCDRKFTCPPLSNRGKLMEPKVKSVHYIKIILNGKLKIKFKDPQNELPFLLLHCIQLQHYNQLMAILQILKRSNFRSFYF